LLRTETLEQGFVDGFVGLESGLRGTF